MVDELMSVPQFRYACAKHGEHQSYLFISHRSQPAKLYCLYCLEEVLTQLGVHGMFPVGRMEETPQAPEPGEDWIPQSLE